MVSTVRGWVLLLAFLPSSAGVLWAEQPSSTQSKPATQKQDGNTILQEVIDRTQTLRLARNRVYLYRESARILATKNPEQATQLLNQALTDIDTAEASLVRGAPRREERMAELEFARRPVLLQLVSVNSNAALLALEAPQSADTDAEFQRLLLDQVASSRPDLVDGLARKKLSYGLTPAVVSAYTVLRKNNPEEASSLAAAIVERTQTQDPKDTAAMQAALLFLRQLRSDEGAQTTKLQVDERLLDRRSLGTLMSYIANGLMAAKDPEGVVRPESLEAYTAGIETYAPEKAAELRDNLQAREEDEQENGDSNNQKAEEAQPTTAEAGPAAAAGTGPQSEQRQAREYAQKQLNTLLSANTTQTKNLYKQILSNDETTIRSVLRAAVDNVNRIMDQTRALAPYLSPECMREGEFEFYSTSPVLTPIASTNGLLVGYGTLHLDAALDAASHFDNPELELLAKLKLAESLLSRSGPAAHSASPAQ